MVAHSSSDERGITSNTARIAWNGLPMIRSAPRVSPASSRLRLARSRSARSSAATRSRSSSARTRVELAEGGPVELRARRDTVRRVVGHRRVVPDEPRGWSPLRGPGRRRASTYASHNS